MGLLLLGVFRGNESSSVISWACVMAAGIAALLLLWMPPERMIVLDGMITMDRFSVFMKYLVLAGVAAAIILSIEYMEREKAARFEYPVLVLLAGAGMMIMLSASNLLAVYMGLELQSLSLYVLTAFRRDSVHAAEAGLKYFILGALSSGMLLFGISLIYGFTGSIDFGLIHSSLSKFAEIPAGAIVGLVFILAGTAFKISAAPFHMWTPDVYQGAPTAVTALLAMAPKVAAIGLLMRLLLGPFEPAAFQWQQIIWFLSAASMITGAFAAMMQSDIKRLMAYSSIGHMGYALIGLAAFSQAGAGAVCLYMLIYVIMGAGAFAVILCLRRDGRSCQRIEDLSGLSRTHPLLAYAMAILMFSMAGIPPLAGFFGKLAIFQSAMTAGLYGLAILGVLTSVVAAYYYLRIVKVMFFEEPTVASLDRGMPLARGLILILCLVFVTGFILAPSSIMATAQNAAAALFPE